MPSDLARLEARVTEKYKNRVVKLAKKIGISVSQLIKQALDSFSHH